jgi:hypothetical protein
MREGLILSSLISFVRGWEILRLSLRWKIDLYLSSFHQCFNEPIDEAINYSTIIYLRGELMKMRCLFLFLKEEKFKASHVWCELVDAWLCLSNTTRTYLLTFMFHLSWLSRLSGFLLIPAFTDMFFIQFSLDLGTIFTWL